MRVFSTLNYQFLPQEPDGAVGPATEGWTAFVGLTANQDHIDGKSLVANSDEGKVLMGTPYDSDIGKLLCQHPHGLGMKARDTLTIFKTKSPGNTSLLQGGTRWLSLTFFPKMTHFTFSRTDISLRSDQEDNLPTGCYKRCFSISIIEIELIYSTSSLCPFSGALDPTHPRTD